MAHNSYSMAVHVCVSALLRPVSNIFNLVWILGFVLKFNLSHIWTMGSVLMIIHKLCSVIWSQVLKDWLLSWDTPCSKSKHLKVTLFLPIFFWRKPKILFSQLIRENWHEDFNLGCWAEKNHRDTVKIMLKVYMFCQPTGITKNSCTRSLLGLNKHVLCTCEGGIPFSFFNGFSLFNHLQLRI